VKNENYMIFRMMLSEEMKKGKKAIKLRDLNVKTRKRHKNLHIEMIYLRMIK
jgi:hypothetical protein